jgi:Xaa-Pro aminopeptidase
MRITTMQDYAAYAHHADHWIDYPGFPIERDFSNEEYDLRLSRTRTQMAVAHLDALVITSSAIGRWFTSMTEPHEWHDGCPARSTWFIVTHSDDYLYMTPTAAGEHFNTTRRSTWVRHIRAIVERSSWPRVENWNLEQVPDIFADLGLSRGRLGFELGDCMTLGLNVNDFLRLRDLLPHAEIVDAAPVVRYLMSHHTPEEIERVRTACQAGMWIHHQVPAALRPGMTEQAFFNDLSQLFSQQYGAHYVYEADEGWDIRNPLAEDSHFFHHGGSNRRFKRGDFVAHGSTGVSYRGYGADIDRAWFIGNPSDAVRHWYRVAWECNRAMTEALRPGALCSDVYAACARVEAQHGLPPRLTGRVGHGLRNSGGLSVHPGNHTVLDPGMIICVEPMFGNEHGWFDVEDQFVITETGAEILHEAAPEQLPLIMG